MLSRELLAVCVLMHHHAFVLEPDNIFLTSRGTLKIGDFGMYNALMYRSHVMSCHVMLCHIMSRHVVSRHIASCDVCSSMSSLIRVADVHV